MLASEMAMVSAPVMGAAWQVLVLERLAASPEARAAAARAQAWAEAPVEAVAAQERPLRVGSGHIYCHPHLEE